MNWRAAEIQASALLDKNTNVIFVQRVAGRTLKRAFPKTINYFWVRKYARILVQGCMANTTGQAQAVYKPVYKSIQVMHVQ